MSVLACTVLQPIADLDISGRRQELDEANVAAILAGLLDGQETPPIGIDEQGRVLWGFHRLEAHARAGRDTIRCDVYRFPSPEAEEAAVISENLRRRHLDRAERDRLLARYVALIGKQREAQSAIFPQAAEILREAPKKGPGKPPSPKRQDIKTAAATTGYSEDTVERAVKAQQEAAAPDSPEPSEPAPPPPCIRTFGVPVAQAVLDRALAIQGRITKASNLLRQVAEQINGLGEAGLRNADFQRLKQELGSVAHAIRRSIPAAVCLYCKAVPGRMPDCHTCLGNGLASLDELERGSAPSELLNEGEAAVYADGSGHFVPVIQRAQLKPPKGKGKKLKTTITDPDGAEREPTEAELAAAPEPQGRAAPPPDDDSDLAF